MSEFDPLVKTIATEIVNQTIWGNYEFYLLVAAVALLSGSLVAFVSSYFKRRGENLATKADFDEILRQLKETTTLAEKIRAEVTAKHEEENSVRALLRGKLEAMLEQTFELEVWFERARSEALNGMTFYIDDCPMAKIEMFQAIYFKELELEVALLKGHVLQMKMWIVGKVLPEGQKAKAENRQAIEDLAGFAELYPPLSKALSTLRTNAIDKYASRIGL